MSICPKCNRRIAENAKVCPYCGAKISRGRNSIQNIQNRKCDVTQHVDIPYAVGYGPPIDMQADVYGPPPPKIVDYDSRIKRKNEIYNRRNYLWIALVVGSVIAIGVCIYLFISKVPGADSCVYGPQSIEKIDNHSY